MTSPMSIAFNIELRGEEVEIRGRMILHSSIVVGSPSATLDEWAAYDDLGNEIEYDPELSEEECTKVETEALEVYEADRIADEEEEEEEDEDEDDYREFDEEEEEE